jgi:ADP-ribose pyrophosphatase YjhB (NUDIX family)
MQPNRFNIRVYGILINAGNEVLVADELIKGYEITKFPGGGLEFGEGTIDCLKREFMEETGQEVEIAEHFYTTDFFQVSAFNPQHQIISIYYLVKPGAQFKVGTKTKRFDFEERKDDAFVFRWIPVKEISEANFSLPIDKIVGKMLQEKFGSN